jgi:hypothetical protein
LESPTIEFQAENLVLLIEAGFDHFEHAGLACTPITVHPYGHRTVGAVTQKLDDRRRDSLVIGLTQGTLR